MVTTGLDNSASVILLSQRLQYQKHWDEYVTTIMQLQ